MVAARILAYGPEYEAEIVDPNTGNKFEYTFNLADCDFKSIDSNVEVNGNDFETVLPVSETKVTYKILTGREEKAIDKELNNIKKTGVEVLPELTTRLRHIITSVNGNNEQGVINNFVMDMLSKDSLWLRQEIQRISPDINLEQEIEIEGETVRVGIPMTVNFFLA